MKQERQEEITGRERTKERDGERNLWVNQNQWDVADLQLSCLEHRPYTSHYTLTHPHMDDLMVKHRH